jgi:hypothetical protein
MFFDSERQPCDAGMYFAKALPNMHSRSLCAMHTRFRLDLNDHAVKGTTTTHVMFFALKCSCSAKLYQVHLLSSRPILHIFQDTCVGEFILPVN